MTAMLLRRSLREPPTPDDFEPLEELPFVVALRGHWRDILRVGGLYVTVNSGFYLIFVYAVSYLTEIVHVPSEAVLDINIVCVFLLVILPPSFALIGDRIGRKPVLISGTIGILVLSYPLFALMNHDNTTLVLLAQIGFAVLFSWIYCANPATMVEVAPYAVRASVLTISINLAMAVFGGTMPLVASYLVERTADDFSPVYYLMGLAMFTLIAVLTCRETYRKELT